MEQLQVDMTAGELSPDMAGRSDSSIYYSGLRKAQNVVLMPEGGVRRRPGLTRCIDAKLDIDEVKMFPFEFSQLDDYLIALSPLSLRVYKDGVLQAELPFFSPMGTVKDTGFTQAGDVMIFTHVDMKPRMLRRKGSDTKWETLDVPLSGIPKYDYGQGDEPVWSKKRGYPGVCTFHQQRLWLAGSKSKPNSVWASKVNSYYDFDIGTGQLDFGIFDTINTDQFNRIINIFSGRDLMVFTTGAEYYNQAEYITSETSVWKKSTGFGSKRMRPVLLDGSTIFVDKLGRNIRSSVFKFEEDAYVAPSITELSSHLFTETISMDLVKGTNIDVSSFVYAVQKDGTCAVKLLSDIVKYGGWTQWTTQGKFVDVCVVNRVVYFLVNRGGKNYIEYMNEGTVLDHNTYSLGTKKTTSTIIHNSSRVTHHGTPVEHTDPTSGHTITSVDTGEDTAIAALDHIIIEDNSIMKSQKGGVITLDRPGYHIEVGLDVPLVVETMPIVVNSNKISVDNIKRIVHSEVVLRDSLGVYVRGHYTGDKSFPVVLDEAPTPFSGIKKVNLMGYDRTQTLKITQDKPLPLRLLGFRFKIDMKGR